MPSNLILPDIGDRNAIGARKFLLAQPQPMAQAADAAAHMGAFDAGDAYIPVFGIIRIGWNRDRVVFGHPHD